VIIAFEEMYGNDFVSFFLIFGARARCSLVGNSNDGEGNAVAE